jgi:hypothetical protein
MHKQLYKKTNMSKLRTYRSYMQTKMYIHDKQKYTNERKRKER